ncbi:MAG: hypothetical protein GY869_03950 [Planctomycetes bacterium]|nr:hypothetical protein [Planctomycetota bacterium]
MDLNTAPLPSNFIPRPDEFEQLIALLLDQAEPGPVAITTAFRQDSPDMVKRYNWQNIRAMLTEGFTPEELRRLCYDKPDFKPVYHQLAQNTGKTKIIVVVNNMLQSLCKLHKPSPIREFVRG